MDEEMNEAAAEQVLFAAIMDGEQEPPPKDEPDDAATRSFLRWLWS